jgi:hypothetical protein
MLLLWPEGHTDKTCRKKKKKEKGENGKKRKFEGNGGGEAKKQKKDTANLAEEEAICFYGHEEEGEDYNYDTFDVSDSLAMDERLSLYDWVADTGTTSHITNRRDAFITYQALGGKIVSGVGGLKTTVQGTGTVEVESIHEGHKYLLRLENTLYIPSNPNNLFSLGRWDTSGGRYTGGGGTITLITKDGKSIARCKKISNNLYRMKLTIRKPGSSTTKSMTVTPQTYLTSEPAQSWETWHKRFGHISYSGLQKILDLNLVNGLNIDTRTPKPDCIPCTEAKQTVEPFNESSERKTEPGELTHIDMWGKYRISSINRNQYYIVFVDDRGRFTSLDFTKMKDEAVQSVKNYVTRLKTLGRKPKALRFDRGKEFINEDLRKWCAEQGIEIQTTAPYSPAQNGIAERMNRTLVELARAMINAHGLPEFLWELAVAHAAYLRNRAFTSPLADHTPYEIWHNNKPNVAHLREFGAPVWILHQGQAKQRKLQPKSARRAYVGYNDGSNSVLYYNAATRKILSSRNFRFLTQTTTPPLTDDIELDPMPEGEKTIPVQTTDKPNNENRKRKIEEEPKERRTRGKRVDYRTLNDPFPDELDEQGNLIVDSDHDQIYAITAGDEHNSLKEAKASYDWPEWQHAMDIEHNQLLEMGTWKLIEPPPNAIPIANKWVYIKKRDQLGKLIKYKARLVAKGYAQRPGYDYVETFSPVVRMETVRAVLALTVKNKYKIQQMDIKGAYLNGILKEKVYMKQPEGYDDGTGRICELIKTIYGLKQSGREWNHKLDTKLKNLRYTRLYSDPCAYIRRDGDNISIITVWVDDLLLFASGDDLMRKIKEEIKASWEVTDMGEPKKIIGIEISHTEDTITISQQRYIESILERENLTDCNPVTTPMDPKIKILPNPEGNEGSRSNYFAQLLGELQFLANATRPDIAFTVNRLSSYTANPTMEHVTALKRILRYLKGTKSYGITYSNSQGDNDDLFHGFFHGFADAAYANTDDYKSTAGYVFIAAGGAITWRSKKQTFTALSTTEAEYVALSEAAREAYWLRNLYEELGIKQESPTTIKGDNNGSISMARNPQFHNRAKHIAVRYHRVRDAINDGIIKIDSCRDPEQTADVLTKALHRFKHRKHIAEMGMKSTMEGT